jgi:hypothetical protein
MLKQNSGRLTLALIALLCSATLSLPQKNDNSQMPPTSKEIRRTCTVQVEVSADDSADKIDRAIVHVESREEGERFTKELKTNRDGVIRFFQVPQGRLLIQVTAEQYQTFGDNFLLTQENQTIRITLKKISSQ